MSSSFIPLFNMVISFAMLLIFIRFMLQFAGFERNHPAVAPAYKATGIVDVFGRIFPTVGDGRVSLAAVMLLFILKLIDLSGNAALAGHGYTPIRLFFEGTLSLILSFLRAARYLIIGSIIISWIVVFTQKMHPIFEIIIQMAEPILAPFRRITPNLGMLDLSPMIAIFGMLLIEIFINIIAQNLLPMVG
ncbi:YggT family protein [Psychrobacter sp. FDAARGOS_221]|uniref:YggT family protein n=1 Tax=Psychrobacter sp. FDAARGOS_221 TaxID=1975705 RepID=UPI000BB5828C|nr:YggT family protein [Psychrobacter sp. FDAARGOS_221]PNK60414.1 YggT family protein [Psychrobacter sp. FDAARGOS_221]